MKRNALTNNNTADFEVVDSLGPCLVAGSEGLPAALENGLEEWLDITDGEQDVAFEQKTGTGKNHILEVVANWIERISSDHATNVSKLFSGLSGIDLVDKGKAPANRQIGPVGAILGVDVSWIDDLVEHRSFLLAQPPWVSRDIGSRNVIVSHVRAMRRGWTIVTKGSHCGLVLLMVPGWNWRLYQMVNNWELMIRAMIRTRIPNVLIAASG